jgi:sporulation protein YlmC with PRC-barrel domain
MRASQLIGLEVLDHAGQRIGTVTDLRCKQDGPLRGAMCAPRITGLLVSPHRLGAVLGYDRHAQHGPWLIRAIVGGLHRNLTVVPWTQVASYDGQIKLKPLGDSL